MSAKRIDTASSHLASPLSDARIAEREHTVPHTTTRFFKTTSKVRRSARIARSNARRRAGNSSAARTATARANDRARVVEGWLKRRDVDHRVRCG